MSAPAGLTPAARLFPTLAALVSHPSSLFQDAINSLSLHRLQLGLLLSAAVDAGAALNCRSDPVSLRRHAVIGEIAVHLALRLVHIAAWLRTKSRICPVATA